MAGISLLNGLSAAGAGIAAFAGTAGLEQQRNDLARQSAILADSLATTRETGLQAQRQAGAETLQAGSQAFQGAQTDKTIAAEAARTATTEGGATARNAATIAAENERSAAARQAAIDLEKLRENAPTETERLFKFLGINPDGTPTAEGVAPSSSTATTPAAPTTSSASTSDTDSPSAAAPTNAAAPTPDSSGQPNLAENVRRKALGLPAPGSPEASRRAIAQDVDSDPDFKYKTAGQKAAEIESRLAVAEGKMTDPAARHQMAAAIASYQLAPLTNFALTKSGGPETMGEVLKLNPDYQETRYPEISKAMNAFGGGGKEGGIIRSLNVGVQHLDVIDQAGEALANGNVQALNSLKNTFERQFGAPEPTTFDALKQIVGTEIEKAVSGGIGAVSDRDRLMKALDAANSPAALQSVTNGFRALMTGQLVGLKTQYEDSTGFKSGPFAFENKLMPATMKALSGDAKPSAKTTSAAPSPKGALANAPMGGLYGATASPSAVSPPPAANPDLLRLWGQ